jgi:hypothetical protein
VGHSSSSSFFLSLFLIEYPSFFWNIITRGSITRYLELYWLARDKMDDRNIFAVHSQYKSRTIFWVDLNEIYVDSYFQGRSRIYRWIYMGGYGYILPG